jgi:signal transduction histidine kinase
MEPAASKMFSIKTKIFCGIIGPALILIAVIYLDYVHLSSLGRSAEHILSKNYRSIKAALQVKHLLEARQNFIFATIWGSSEIASPNRESNQEIARLIQVCKDNVTETGEQQTIAVLFEDYERYEPLFQSFITADVGKTNAIKFYKELISTQANLNQSLDTLIVVNEKAMEAAEKETRKVARRAQQYSLTLLMVAILLSLVWSYVLATRISRPLISLAKGLAAVKQGGPDYPQFPATTRDEIGFLSSEFNRLFERLRVFDQISKDELSAQKLKVRQAEEAKARFIADLSHQLKTPMTSLSMSVGILAEKLRGVIGGKHGQLLETARTDCCRLSALINELVDISKLDATLKPRPKEILLIEEVINKSLKPLLHQAEEKGIHLGTEIESDLTPIAIDSFRFPWVITNLVGNAIRYTDRGGRVTLRVVKRDQRYYFRCIDTGTGIKEEYLSKIFDRFTQFSEREKTGAIGLGLAIVKDVIEQHGGDISVESKVGEGTTFTFWIPIQTEDVNGESSRS